jgi:hypothetical protein
MSNILGHTITFYCPSELKARITEAAGKEDRSVSKYLARLLAANVPDEASTNANQLGLWGTTTNPPVETPPALRSTKIKRPTSKKTTRRTHHGK